MKKKNNTFDSLNALFDEMKKSIRTGPRKKKEPVANLAPVFVSPSLEEGGASDKDSKIPSVAAKEQQPSVESPLILNPAASNQELYPLPSVALEKEKYDCSSCADKSSDSKQLEESSIVVLPEILEVSSLVLWERVEPIAEDTENSAKAAESERSTQKHLVDEILDLVSNTKVENVRNEDEISEEEELERVGAWKGIDEILDLMSMDEEDEDEIEEFVDELQNTNYTETFIAEFEEMSPRIKTAFAGIIRGDEEEQQKFFREIHTWKGNIAGIGGQKTRYLLDKLENEAGSLKEPGFVPDETFFEKISAMLSQAENQTRALFDVYHQRLLENGSETNPEQINTASRKIVRIPLETIEDLFEETNESRLTSLSLKNSSALQRQKMKDIDGIIDRVSRLARDIEIQVETQIQSRQIQLAEANKDFDALELDRFSLSQERCKSLIEALSDLQDSKRDMIRLFSEQEADFVYLERGLDAVTEGLQKSRLLSVDSTINSRLHRLVVGDAKFLGKSVSLNLTGGRAMLDRSVLERVVVPLEHLLRNSLAHGIESPEERERLGKEPMGKIHVIVSQEAGRVLFVVEDDGAGLNVERIRMKAIEKGLWDADKQMSDAQAADIICMPGFSTVDVSNMIAGKGVGMDVVRHDVLAMGGRFELFSNPGKGLRVVIQLPTTISTTSVLVVESGNESYSLPVEIVDNVLLLKGDELKNARKTSEVKVGDETVPFAELGEMLGLQKSKRFNNGSSSVLLLKEGSRKVAVEVTQIQQVIDSPLRTLSSLWNNVKGIIGATLLPDGTASFLVDPLRVTWNKPKLKETKDAEVVSVPNVVPSKPLIMVVDDSITVRKHTNLFLQRLNYDVILAKDGVDALEALNNSIPSLILLDVEMPRMDGFDCTKNIRSNPNTENIPIIMITSRIANKHRERAKALGVNEYIGKPFNEQELESLIKKYLN